MNVTEAVDLLSIAARSSTWDARPADAAVLLEVVRGLEAEVERLRASWGRMGAQVVALKAQLADTAARQREACAEAMRPILRSMLSRGKAADLCRATPLVTDGPTPYAAGSRLEAKQARDLAVLKGRVLDLEERLGLPLSTFTDLDGPVAHEGSPTVVGGTTPGGIVLPSERRHDVKPDESAAVTYDGNVSAVSPRVGGLLSGTPRGPELDAAVRERCECGHPWSKHRPGKYGGCCEWGCMCERLPRAAVREQPAPKPGGEAVWPSLLASGLVPESLRADCEARHRLGVERYGRALETHNGRDALADAYQEALDLAVYLWQAQLEAGAGVSGSFWRRVAKDAVAVAENIKEAMR